MRKMAIFPGVVFLSTVTLLFLTENACNGSRSGSSKETESIQTQNATSSKISRDRPFGLDYIYPDNPDYNREDVAQLFEEAGLQWVNFADVKWGKIEPNPPRKGHHRYIWRTLDEGVRLWERHGFHIVVTLKSASSWASGEISREPIMLADKPLLKRKWAKKVDRLPAPEHMDDYRAFIKALVERYDGDGKEDMPGLMAPILHYQIGNEYVHEGFWGGTVEDYGILLKEAYQAVKEANEDVKVVLAGIAWNDLFYNDLDGDEFERVLKEKLKNSDEKTKKGWMETTHFTREELKFTDWYDIVDVRGNGPFPHSYPGYLSWVKKQLGEGGRIKRLWDIESRCEPQLAYHEVANFHEEIYCENGKDIISKMKGVPYAMRASDKLWEWYRAEQASQLVKVVATRLGYGVEKVFIGYPIDWDLRLVGALSAEAHGAAPWVGFLDKQYKPQPAYFAYKQIISLLDGFSGVEKSISTEDGLWHFTFKFPDRRVHVIWYHDDRPNCPGTPEGEKEIELNLSSNKVKQVPVINRLGQTRSKPQKLEKQDGPYKLVIRETPVFVVEEW